MSFEGYYEALCENGHVMSCDVHAAYCDLVSANPFDWVCPHCGKPICWYQVVDETNGLPFKVDEDGNETDEYSDLYDGQYRLEEETGIVTSTCEHCHMTKIVAEPRYKVPPAEVGNHRKG